MKTGRHNLINHRAPSPPRALSRLGFTLLELLVAITILVVALSIAFQAFGATIRGWRRGLEVMEGIQHGDFALKQVVSALNSTIYFKNNRRTYAFTFEKESSGGLPADTIRFVTSSGAMMPYDSPFAAGPHRLKLYIDDEDGYPALFATAMPAVPNADDEEEELEGDPILVSREVQGLEIMVWDEENEDWTEEWEKANSVPERIRISVYVASEDENEDPIVFSRVLNIPVAESLRDNLASPTIQNSNNR